MKDDTDYINGDKYGVHAHINACGTGELTGRSVFKYTSPNNPCSHVGNECRYETGEMLRDE